MPDDAKSKMAKYCNKYENSLRRITTLWMSKIILNISDVKTKNIFRNSERIYGKLIRMRYHLRFNEACLQHNLLPIYTNIKLHDEAAKPQQFVTEFRRNLIANENEKQRSNIHQLESALDESLQELKECQSEMRFESCILFLHRRIQTLETELTIKHTNKLCSLYGGPVCLQQSKNSYINLSDQAIPTDIQDVF